MARVAPTPEIQNEVRKLCEGWQDSNTLIALHAIMQANLVSAVLQLGNGNVTAPDPMRLRVDAADIRCAGDGFAQFLENLADRIESRSN